MISMETTLVDQFVQGVIQQSDFEKLDAIYLKNRVLNLIGEGNFPAKLPSDDLVAIKDELIQVAIQNHKIADVQNERDELGAELMDLITPAPSIVNRRFWKTYQQDPQQAIADFYDLSRRNDYIKTKAIAKNIYFKHPSEYGDLEITINLSKPEKDPKQIAQAKKMKATGYPKCNLCIENEGYQGRANTPARANHRVIRFKIGDHEWGFQYSPYAYFNEHCIFLDTVHEEMVINKDTFQQLLTIVQQFPGYFAGSNADLPIVGGSILSHEHYQGGRHTFAMEKAPIETPITFRNYDGIQAGIVKWPMSVIRLNGADLNQMCQLADKIFQKWDHYSDESVSVVDHSESVRHHTITPIARMRDGRYELDLVLRDNQTSAQYPDGIFHPHQDVQHIKKENIGLIEVMGLAILPPRLKAEMQEVEKYLLDQANSIADYHRDWADQIKKKNVDLNQNNVHTIVQNEIGKVFTRVLEDAGVFKRDEQGKRAFMKFIDAVND